MEGAIVSALLFAMALLAMLSMLPFEWLVRAGMYAIGGGFAIGLPASFIYHLALYRVLQATGGVPRGWLFRPTQYHARIAANDRPRVLVPFAIGAFGFLLCVVGCVLLIVGSWRGA